VSGWITPALAASIWAGLLARPSLAGAEPAWMWLLGGIVAMGAALATAPGRGSPSLLEGAGLVRRDLGEALVETVSPSPVAPGGGRARAAGVLALGAAFLLAVGWGSAHEHRVRDALLARLAPATVRVEGSLRVDPEAERDRWSAILDVRVVRWDGGAAKVRETVWLAGRGDPPDAVRADRLAVEGSLEVPGEAGFAAFLLRRGIAAELNVSSAERLGPAGFAPVRWAQSFRSLVGRSIVETFPPREAGLLLGLALGDDSRLDPVVERDFRASGLSHLLVVSGGNVAMVLMPVLALGAALRLSRWPRFALGLGIVVFFVVLTGAEPSVMRAGVMAGLALVGMLLGRPRSSGSVLAGAVVALLALDPALVWSVGFQLSVAATAGMVALATPIAERLGALPRPVAMAAGATLAAQVGVTPVLLFWFHEVPLSTIGANVLAFPVVAPSMLLGLLAAGAGLVVEPLGRAIAWVALVPMRYLEAVADRLARAPVPWITGGGMATLVLGLLGAIGLAWWLRSGRRLGRPALVCLLALAPLVVWTNATAAGPPAALTVRFIDVGQGDATLLTSPGGATILVDGGPDPALVATELVSLGVRRLDLMVATHPHADHIVGLPAVLARMPVSLLLEPGCPDESPDHEALLEAAEAEGVPVRAPRAGEVLWVGDVRLQVLAPSACWFDTDSDPNNDSIVLLAGVGGDTVLLTGDAEIPAQEALLASGVPLLADVLKVPHHGGATSVPGFFTAIGAAIAVVSAGQPNPYGHPTAEALGWLRDAGARIVRTDLTGDVVLTFVDGRPVVASAA
jgi:DNA internalization-related competence protein ComEC/Rec2